MRGFTPTERRIYDMLSDGTLHSVTELMTVLDDELALPMAIRPHISKMRAKLSQSGEDIVSRDGGYYLARKISPYNE